MTVTDVVLGCICGYKSGHVCTAWPALPEMPTSTAEVLPASGERGVAPDAAIVQAIVGLPARLKAYRAAHGLSLTEAAERSGVSSSTLQRIERGRDYSVDSLIGVAAWLDEQR